MLLRIFHFLPHPTLLITTAVSLRWQPLARSVYFSRVVVTQDTRAIRLARDLRIIGQSVTSLSILPGARLTRSITLINLIRRCPFLLELELASALQCKWFWDSDITLNRLRSVNVQQMSENHPGRVTRFLHSIAYRHRGTFERLYIPNIYWWPRIAARVSWRNELLVSIWKS